MEEVNNEFLSEKIELEEFLIKIETEINSCLEDFEKLNGEKLDNINDLINDMEATATVFNKKFYDDYVKFKVDFNFFVTNFEEMKRYKVETYLEDFLEMIDILKKDIF